MSLPINSTKIVQNDEQRAFKALQEKVRVLEEQLKALQPKPEVKK